MFTFLYFFFQAVFVDLKPDPVDILGIAKITRSPSNQQDGPWFYVDSRQIPPFIEVKIKISTDYHILSRWTK